MQTGIYERQAVKVEIPVGVSDGVIYRTLGSADSGELLGGGYMVKHKIGADHLDFSPQIYSLSYLASGTGSYVDCWGRVWRLGAGSFFQRIPGYPHSNYIEAGEEWFELFVDIGPEMAGVLEKMGLLNPRVPCGQIGVSRDWVRAFLDLRIEIAQADEEQLRFTLPKVLDLMQRVFSAARKPADADDAAMVSLACQRLGADLAQRLEVEDLCREQGWGYERFRKVFREHVGISPAQYRIRRRIDEARRMLLGHPELAIKDIAGLLGYSSVYEFSAQFSRATGSAPGQFRKGRG